MIRYYCNFESAFRSESAPCISHETVDKIKTLCGRLVYDAATLEPASSNLDPDCGTCRRALAKLKRDASKVGAK